MSAAARQFVEEKIISGFCKDFLTAANSLKHALRDFSERGLAFTMDDTVEALMKARDEIDELLLAMMLNKMCKEDQTVDVTAVELAYNDPMVVMGSDPPKELLSVIAGLRRLARKCSLGGIAISDQAIRLSVDAVESFFLCLVRSWFRAPMVSSGFRRTVASDLGPPWPSLTALCAMVDQGLRDSAFEQKTDSSPTCSAVGQVQDAIGPGSGRDGTHLPQIANTLLLPLSEFPGVRERSRSRSRTPVAE